MEEFMALKGFDKGKVAEIRNYLAFLSDRAKGEVPTGAKFIRDLVTSHTGYKKDSVVSNEVAYDLMAVIVNIEKD